MRELTLVERENCQWNSEVRAERNLTLCQFCSPQMPHVIPGLEPGVPGSEVRDQALEIWLDS
jgi:hypothetical protein